MGRYFGTDGIRGFANETLTVDTAYKIGRYIGAYYADKGGKITIGKDTRKSSDMLEAALAAGIAASGSDAYLLGYCSTPCLALVTKNEKFSVGAMISASHNPYYDNGIKLFSNTGVKLAADIENLIEDYIDNPVGIDLAKDDKIGRIYNYEEGVDHYVEFVQSKFDFKNHDYKILLDLANGSASYTAEKVYSKFFKNVTYMNNEPNGTNINNHCGSTHLEMLREEMKTGKYDIGFAYDGDADRVLCIDSKGNDVDGDKVMFILSKDLKSRNELKDNTLVITIMSNLGLRKACEENGIKCDITPVGDKYVLESMMKNDFSIGGEQSGHIINLHYTNFGDGVLTSLMLLQVIDNRETTVEVLASEINTYPQLLKNIRVNDKEGCLNSEKVLARVDEVSKILEGRGRISYRASGTEPLIRVMVEAESDKECEELVDSVIDLIKELGFEA